MFKGATRSGNLDENAGDTTSYFTEVLPHLESFSWFCLFVQVFMKTPPKNLELIVEEELHSKDRKERNIGKEWNLKMIEKRVSLEGAAHERLLYWNLGQKRQNPLREQLWEDGSKEGPLAQFPYENTGTFPFKVPLSLNPKLGHPGQDPGLIRDLTSPASTTITVMGLGKISYLKRFRNICINLCNAFQ